MKTATYYSLLAFTISSSPLLAQDIIELDTTTIKGNTELPKTMYVVPWQDKTRKDSTQQKLKLHNLYSDFFDPVMPAYVNSADFAKFKAPVTKK